MSIRGVFGRRRVPGPDLERYYRSELEANRSAGTAGREIPRDGYLPEDEADVLLVPDADGYPPIRLIATERGFEFATAQGDLIHYEASALRRFGIYTCSVSAMSYYQKNADRPDFRNGQRLRAVREPANPYDSNAVVLTTWRPARGIGYVNQDRAEWVAQALDSGETLHAFVLQNVTYGPRVIMTTAKMLAHLCRKPT